MVRVPAEEAGFDSPKTIYVFLVAVAVNLLMPALLTLMPAANAPGGADTTRREYDVADTGDAASRTDGAGDDLPAPEPNSRKDGHRLRPIHCQTRDLRQMGTPRVP